MTSEERKQVAKHLQEGIATGRILKDLSSKQASTFLKRVYAVRRVIYGEGPNGPLIKAAAADLGVGISTMVRLVAGYKMGGPYELVDAGAVKRVVTVRSCRVCGCTDDDCSQCIRRTGHPCHWVAADLCSACKPSGH